VGDFIYTTNTDYATIVGYTGTNLNVVIPGYFGSFPVASIGDNAFLYQADMASVSIPNTVKSIGNNAFSGCGGLSSISIPGSVTNIGSYAFSGCGFASVTFLNCPASIGDYAFFDCTWLASLTLPDSITGVGNWSFANCTSLTNVTIANGVASIGDDAFYYDFSIQRVTIGMGNGSLLSQIGNDTFMDCHSLTDIIINGNRLATIGSAAFMNCYSLTGFNFGTSVVSIGSDAFENCSQLVGVYFFGNAPNMDSTVFSGSSIAKIYYLPGTSGWSSTNAAVPTAQWYLPNPLILNSSPDFGMNSNGFGFTISWATNMSVVIDASTNLAGWLPITTNSLVNGTNYFRDPQWTNYPGRFYRIRSSSTQTTP